MVTHRASRSESECIARLAINHIFSENSFNLKFLHIIPFVFGCKILLKPYIFAYK